MTSKLEGDGLTTWESEEIGKWY